MLFLYIFIHKIRLSGVRASIQPRTQGNNGRSVVISVLAAICAEEARLKTMIPLESRLASITIVHIRKFYKM